VVEDCGDTILNSCVTVASPRTRLGCETACQLQRWASDNRMAGAHRGPHPTTEGGEGARQRDSFNGGRPTTGWRAGTEARTLQRKAAGLRSQSSQRHHGGLTCHNPDRTGA